MEAFPRLESDATLSGKADARAPADRNGDGKFALVGRYCSGAVAPRAPAPRAAQLEVYATGYRSGSLSASADGPVSSEAHARLRAPMAELALTPITPVAAATLTPTRQRFNSQTQRILDVAQTLNAAAQRHDIDPLLLHAIAHVESRHNAQAVSPAGARGLMQVMPATAKRFGLMDPHRELMAAPLNVDVSAAYLKTLQRRFGNDLPLVLAAYNAGEGAVERYGRRIPNYPETRDYVQQVLRAYQALRDTVSANRSSTP